MAIKTFTTGDVLTASDTNTYLNNGGLVYITAATVTGTPTTLAIDNCFSATYENYRVEIKYSTPGTGNPAVYVNWRAGGSTAATATYSQMGNGRSSANADQSYGATGQTLAYVGGLPGSLTFDVISPFSAVPTTTFGQTTFYDGTNYIMRVTGTHHNVSSSYDGLLLSIASSTFTSNMTVRVYGYRQA
jgi:hypothetical protein